MNRCVLSESYLAMDEESRADAELLCVKENADAARYCATLREKCAAGLAR